MNWNGITLSILLTCDMDYVVLPQKRGGNIMREKLKKAALHLIEKQIDKTISQTVCTVTT